MKKMFIIFLALIMVFVLVGCNSSAITGTYKRLKDEKHSFVFEKGQKGKGSFIEYFNGEKLSEEFIRNEWEITDGLLILNDGDERFKIYNDCIIRLEDGSDEPEDYEFIAPTGKYFDYTISDYEFYSNGTYSVTGSYLEGEYYKKGNIIYMTFPWSWDEDIEGYIPGYYIYNDDHIVDAHYVYTK